MLIKASVKNFKSFDGDTELNMISSSKIRSHSNHKVKIKQTTILKNSVIYGANASGKSNIIEFFHFFKWTVERGLPLVSRDFFCKNKEENAHLDSEFEIQFTVDDKFYAYGFSATLLKGTITGEWLYELKQDGSATPIFKREQHQKPTLNAQVSLSTEEQNRFDVYSNDYTPLTDTLFLTEMNRNKKYSENSNLLFFQKIYRWITNNILVITPSTSITNLEYYYNEASLSKINKLLKSFDTGISEVLIKKIDMEEIKKSLPEQIYEDILENIETQMKDKTNVRMTMRIGNNFFNIVVNPNEPPQVSTICMKHGTSNFDFTFEDESDGTRRFFELMDLILAKKEDTVYIVDELERSLHPKLTAHFLELFMKFHADDRVQLVFSTHEASIMDLNLFRRDEFWFIERDAENRSNLYSLDRFKERYDTKLSKAYLEGRYGAIPVFQLFQYIGGE